MPRLPGNRRAANNAPLQLGEEVLRVDGFVFSAISCWKRRSFRNDPREDPFGSGGALDAFLVLRLGWPAVVHEGCEQIDRDWKERRSCCARWKSRAWFGGSAVAVQSAPCSSSGGLHHFFRRLKFALGVDDLGPALALGFGLLSHGALHGVGQRHIFYLDRRDFDTLWFGLPVDDLLQLQVIDSRCESRSSSGAWPSTLRSVVWAISEVAWRNFTTFTTAASGSTTRK
jgi:hypothetical protein